MNHSSSSSSSKMLMNCNCGIPTAIKTLWTFQNPGRKFATCKFYNQESEMRGCRFFEWVVTAFILIEDIIEVLHPKTETKITNKITQLKFKYPENKQNSTKESY
ncbi:hypothetical protein RND81_13G107200 [Saponaria officinalis]|uniref:GRF-type domain-containing protein n=1 Tax=Saponaria officinalis TaxID=3572 RepID=A0AAW1GWC0_SAPOF